MQAVIDTVRQDRAVATLLPIMARVALAFLVIGAGCRCCRTYTKDLVFRRQLTYSQ
jgi:hypothetical protein